MSLYREYLRERGLDEILEQEEGFATYRFIDHKTVYIVDIYVLPEFRKKGLARDIADSIARFAKEKGCIRMVGSVVPSAKGSAESMKVLLAYGMVPDSSTNDFVLFRKDL